MGEQRGHGAQIAYIPLEAGRKAAHPQKRKGDARPTVAQIERRRLRFRYITDAIAVTVIGSSFVMMMGFVACMG